MKVGFYLQQMQFILQKEISQATKMYIGKAICTDKDFFHLSDHKNDSPWSVFVNIKNYHRLVQSCSAMLNNILVFIRTNKIYGLCLVLILKGTKAEPIIAHKMKW